MTICCTYVVPKIPLKMINVRTVLRKKQLSDGSYPICLDKPGKLTHLRRMKLTMANGLPRFDLSLG